MISDLLAKINPREINANELPWLVTPAEHNTLLAERRSALILARVRLLATLFAVCSPLWIIVDLLVFPMALVSKLAVLRLLTCAGFAVAAYLSLGRKSLWQSYIPLGLLFSIPVLFHFLSVPYFSDHIGGELSQALTTAYTSLPYVLVAGISVFPLALVESFGLVAFVLLFQAISFFLGSAGKEWGAFTGNFWLLLLIGTVAAMACMGQLISMIALVHQATRDLLTGVFSRRSGVELLGLQFILATRSGAPLSLAFLDLDHFKSVNDQYGHEAGDTVLRAAAQSIAGNLRGGDMLARWGGEEFLVIMPNTALAGAAKVIERLREAGLGLRPDQAPVTASIGMAERVADSIATAEDLVATADRRMYAAKLAGRDRVLAAD